MLQTYSVLMNKRDDAMARLYGFLCGRALHVHSSAAGTTEDGKHWRVTLVIDPTETSPEKLEKELNRLMDVTSVTPLTTQDCISRRYALVSVQAGVEQRPYVRQVVSAAGGRVVQQTPGEMMIEVSGCQDSINAFADNLRVAGYVRMNCTGPVALEGHVQEVYGMIR